MKNRESAGKNNTKPNRGPATSLPGLATFAGQELDEGVRLENFVHYHSEPLRSTWRLHRTTAHLPLHFFDVPLGSSGQGFTTPLTEAETNVDLGSAGARLPANIAYVATGLSLSFAFERTSGERVPMPQAQAEEIARSCYLSLNYGGPRYGTRMLGPGIAWLNGWASPTQPIVLPPHRHFRLALTFDRSGAIGWPGSLLVTATLTGHALALTNLNHVGHAGEMSRAERLAEQAGLSLPDRWTRVDDAPLWSTARLDFEYGYIARGSTFQTLIAHQNEQTYWPESGFWTLPDAETHVVRDVVFDVYRRTAAGRRETLPQEVKQAVLESLAWSWNVGGLTQPTYEFGTLAQWNDKPPGARLEQPLVLEPYRGASLDLTTTTTLDAKDLNMETDEAICVLAIMPSLNFAE